MNTEQWWTSPLESENGRIIMVTGRADVRKFRDNPKFSIRVDITLPYDSKPDGMPTDAAAITLETVLENIRAELDKDPVAILTGIYTGDGERNMVFYTLSTNIFNKKLNSALAALPLLPLQITAENDPTWAEYTEMRSLSEIN